MYIFSSLSVVIDSHLTRVINVTWVFGTVALPLLWKKKKVDETKMFGRHLPKSFQCVAFFICPLFKVVWMVALVRRRPKQLAKWGENKKYVVFMILKTCSPLITSYIFLVLLFFVFAFLFLFFPIK